jgi:hypothetical protein
LAAIKQNFGDHFSSFEHRRVHVQLILLNYLEVCAKIHEDNQQKEDAVMMAAKAKAMTLGIEATRLAADGNNPIMANNLSKLVDVS